jgi:hypothetical protein
MSRKFQQKAPENVRLAPCPEQKQKQNYKISKKRVEELRM